MRAATRNVAILAAIPYSRDVTAIGESRRLPAGRGSWAAECPIGLPLSYSKGGTGRRKGNHSGTVSLWFRLPGIALHTPHPTLPITPMPIEVNGASLTPTSIGGSLRTNLSISPQEHP
jgi:hypothetical protein